MKKIKMLVIVFVLVTGIANAQISRFIGTWEAVVPAGTEANFLLQVTNREAYVILNGQRIGPFMFAMSSADTLLLFDGGTAPTTFRWISDGTITMLPSIFNPAMSFRRIRR